MNELHIATALTLVLIVATSKVVRKYMNSDATELNRKEYFAIQELKPKLEKYNMRMHEVSEGLFQVVQYAKTSNKPVFQLSKGRKGLNYTKLDSDYIDDSIHNLMTASYLNSRLK